VGGDEIIYLDKRLLIHFHEGDDYIKSNYPKEKIISLRDKLWIENPYMSKYAGIQYVPEAGGNIFESLLTYYSYNKEIDMSPVYVQGLQSIKYTINNRIVNALYKKVEDGNFYMIGDNRDNSNDSRFWGSVPYSLVVGQPWLIYFSIEHRGYNKMLNGDDEFGSGRDHAGLKRICGEIDISSKECEALWNNERYSIRWGRMGRQIESLQQEQPIQ
jgi:signal peptidase I